MSKLTQPWVTQAETDGRATPTPLCVWIVDDSPLQRELCQRVLSRDYTVRAFDGGNELLEALTGQAPHVLVVDWQMPDISGLDVCRFVRQTRNMAQLPILIVTAAAKDSNLLEALAAGANDFVNKPFVEAELLARVSTLVTTATLHARLVEIEHRLLVEAEFRERFMGMLAHDLRQPLNAISMANQLLAEPQSDPVRMTKLLEIQKRAGGRMRRMISELLDFTLSRPETGIPIQRRHADLEQIVRACVHELALGEREWRVDIKVEGECTGNWDADRLAQVCGNLLCNAIEHAPAGTAIEVELIGEGTYVYLRVTNKGPEIPARVLATLFEPFRRGEQPNRASGGVGLGLHIVDQIARAHDGSVRATSKGGQNRFEIRLPRNL